MKSKKKILLTGASGSMGSEAFKELLKRSDKYEIVLLLQPNRNEKKAFARYKNQNGLEIVWGDLRNSADVMKAVDGADHVLHTAAIIPPAADRYPGLAREVNVRGTENIIEAIKRQPDNGDHVRFIYIASVALYGDRLPPNHVVRVGDPLCPSVGDHYAVTKMAAERAVIESGLKHWTSLRQTYIAIPNSFALFDSILFHQPLNTHIELITPDDAGYGLVQTLETPDEFYGKVYNMSGGPSCRMVYKDYLARMMRIMGLGDYQAIMDPNWFALKNFHCCWYDDGHVLEGYLGHWRHTLDDHYRQVEEFAPKYLKLAVKVTPTGIIKAVLKKMADPLRWARKKDREKIEAFFGSLEAWERIPGWSGLETAPQTNNKPGENESSSALEKASLFGGECLSPDFTGVGAKMRWKCAEGHEWQSTPGLVEAGHWCPECAPPRWATDRKENESFI